MRGILKISKKTALMSSVALTACLLAASCGGKTEVVGWSRSTSHEAIIKEAAEAGKIGNWGGGNEYEVYALLNKYSLPLNYISQAFDMDGFDTDQIWLASAMTYNELGLVQNSYTGGYGYGNNVGIIDMNEEGTAMLEDNIFCTTSFAEQNPATVRAFIYASVKGWAYAAEHPEEAAEIVYNAGSSVSQDHQLYMAQKVAELVTTDTNGNTITSDKVGQLDDVALQNTLNLAKQYITLEDSTAQANLNSMTLDQIRNKTYYEAAMASTPEALKAELEASDDKKSVSIQLKWLPQSQFMGYYVAASKGYYDEVGLTVNIVSGGGDIGETTGVNQGTVDFGVTWSSNIIASNSAGMSLINVAQIYQSSGLVLVYKYTD